MPSPTSSLATLRPDLAGSLMEFDLAASQAGLVGLQIFPAFEVMTAAGAFGRIPSEQLKRTFETARAPGAPYSRSKTRFEPDSFVTREHGHEEPVDDNEAAMYAEYFDAELVAAMRAREAVLENHERRVIDLVTDTGVWTGAALATNVAAAWNVPASALPVENVTAAKVAVYNNSGIIANAVIMSWAIFEAIKNAESIIDRIKHSGRDDPKNKNITRQIMADMFGVEHVIVAGAQRNTANEGQAMALSSLWPNARVMVCKVATGPDIREACIGRTFHWGADGSTIGSVIESYREEQTRADVIRARMQTHEKRLYVEAGHLLTGVA